MKKSSYKFYWKDTLLEMLPSRALFLVETKELLICDIHLGKAEYFQQNGIPLTNNADENNFSRIKKIVKNYSPEKLIILGDLFHSKYSIGKNLQKKVEDLPELLKTNVELVLGNHDVGCDIKNIKIFDTRKTKNITFSHEPVNLENKRISRSLERLKNLKMLLNEIKTPTPFAFPLLVERLKNTLSNEPIEKRVEKLIKKYSD